jgi:hypothetical protein
VVVTQVNKGEELGSKLRSKRKIEGKVVRGEGVLKLVLMDVLICEGGRRGSKSKFDV